MRLDLAGDDSGNFIFMKLIPLSKTGKHKGKYFAQVDDEDYDVLNKWSWYVSIFKHTRYAERRETISIGVSRLVKMHRVIMEIKDSQLHIDHKDFNGLNNQKVNLRVVTNKQNQLHKQSIKGSTSKYLGVSWAKSKNKWVAQIMKDKKQIYIGRFHSEKEAAEKRDKKAKELFGEFENLNFPMLQI